MPSVSKQSTEAKDHGPVLDHSGNIEGYGVNFVTFRQDMDQTPLLKGLPGDSCHCPHWGYVLKGRLRFRVGDREEIFEAGDAFYLPPGHIGIGNEPGTEYMQFSPADGLRSDHEEHARGAGAVDAGLCVQTKRLPGRRGRKLVMRFLSAWRLSQTHVASRRGLIAHSIEGSAQVFFVPSVP